MNRKFLAALILGLFVSVTVFSQRPPRPEGRPGTPGQPPMGGAGPNRPGIPNRAEWFEFVDANKSGTIDMAEVQAVVAATFAEFDKNSNGTIEATELPTPKPSMGPGERMGDRSPSTPMGPPPGGEMKKTLPAFFFAETLREGGTLDKTQFETAIKTSFSEMDKNRDGALSREEARPPRQGQGPPSPPRGEGPPMPPNARFIGAEMRFGDKLVKGQAFSAEIVIEDTRRLFDGTTVTKQNRGAVYRDGEGRTRREQPLEMVGGVNIVGTDNKPQKLVFINDFASRSHIFLDLNNKIARRGPIGAGPGPQGPGTPPDAKTESLGTKTIEGVTVTGTRTTFEIPAGQVGNDKPMAVVSERWFSEDLQVVVMSRNVDPISGEHIFKLVNIKRTEPATDLFAIPAGFKIESQPGRAPQPE